MGIYNKPETRTNLGFWFAFLFPSFQAYFDIVVKNTLVHYNVESDLHFGHSYVAVWWIVASQLYDALIYQQALTYFSNTFNFLFTILPNSPILPLWSHHYLRKGDWRYREITDFNHNPHWKAHDLLHPIRPAWFLSSPPSCQTCQTANIVIYMRAQFTYSNHDQTTVFNSIDTWVYKLLLTYLLLIWARNYTLNL